MLELIPDANMYLFFSKGTRGGVFKFSRYIAKPTIDTNKLYGYAISSFHPVGGFKRICPKELNLRKHGSNSSKFRALEVPLEHLKE